MTRLAASAAATPVTLRSVDLIRRDWESQPMRISLFFSGGAFSTMRRMRVAKTLTPAIFPDPYHAVSLQRGAL
ncbi:MAG: hypothetical protein ACRETU_10160, partial [Steroidobacterales bacterium]